VRYRFLTTFIAAMVAVASSVVGLVPSAQGATAPCGTMSLAKTSYKHVLWIFMENHSYGAIIGQSGAPYINKIAGQCGLATNYHNVTHPSLPNYIAATSGLSLSGVQKFTSDCTPSSTCSTSSSSIFSQVKSWRAYEDSMPSACDKSNAGEYAPRHNPPLYYTTLSGCSSYDVPYPKLATALANNKLPAFAFVTPDLINDMHDGTVAQGDSWLSKNLPPILNSTAYRSGSLVVVLTWDEGENGSSSDCATNATDVGCHVATIVMSPSTAKGTKSHKLFNHYSLLRTTEELLHLSLLRQAKSANSMRTAFNL
jgi:hypothetical protein